MKQIAVMTGTRADYGLLQPIISLIEHHPEMTLQLLVTGSHLSSQYGDTWKQIEQDGFKISACIPILTEDDSPAGIARSTGKAVLGFADTLSDDTPDCLVVLGDRYEALAAAEAALLMAIPIVHIHGGELTEGAVDDAIRHAISKMASLHFVSHQQYARRLMQMGEPEDRIMVTGAPGIDNILNMKKMNKAEIERSLNFSLGESCFLVTYHPVTRSTNNNDDDLQGLFESLDKYPNSQIVWTYPNADANSQYLIDQIKSYAFRNKNRVMALPSLGQRRYISMLSHADLVIGNSSSGIIEVPSFKIPTINIGDRQKGRIRVNSIVDCLPTRSSINSAIEMALSKDFQASLSKVVNPYGDGNSADKIVNALSSISSKDLGRKPFVDRNII